MPEFKTLFDNFRETFLDVASPMNLAGLDSAHRGALLQRSCKKITETGRTVVNSCVRFCKKEEKLS